MSLELHERGIHAVWAGGPGRDPGSPEPARTHQHHKPRNRETPERTGL